MRDSDPPKRDSDRPRHDSDRPTRPDLSKPRCPSCKGERRTTHVVERGTSYASQSNVCRLCHGKGWVDLETYHRWERAQNL